MSAVNIYVVETDGVGCKSCGAGRLWHAVGSNGIASSVSYEDIEEAEREARRWNQIVLSTLEDLRNQDGCWCSTGEGNPHTARCLDVSMAVALIEASA